MSMLNWLRRFAFQKGSEDGRIVVGANTEDQDHHLRIPTAEGIERTPKSSPTWEHVGDDSSHPNRFRGRPTQRYVTRLEFYTIDFAKHMW